MWNRLRDGGLILYFRHPDTDKSAGDTDVEHPLNFAAQRQLSDLGRSQARTIGGALREHAVPIDRVYCTEYQRGFEAASLMDVGEPERLECLTSLYKLPGAVVAARVQAVRVFLSRVPPEGSNILVVSHGPNLEEAMGGKMPELPEGAAAILRPNGDTFEVLQILTPEQWAQEPEMR